MPLKVSGMIFQSGWRSGAVARMTTHTASPITGTTSSSAGNFRLAVTLAPMAIDKDRRDDADRGPVDLQAARRVLHDRRMAVLLERRRDAVDQEARDRRDIGLEHRQRADAVDPHHGGGGVADHAAGAAGVGRRDDRGEIADVDFALEHVARHRAADQRGRDVVEEARQHEHDGEQREPALPAVGQERRHLVGNAAVLEMPRQDRKAHQQQEQVREDHPFVLHVQAEAGQSGAELEAGEDQLVEDDRGEAGERDLKRAGGGRARRRAASARTG